MDERVLFVEDGCAIRPRAHLRRLGVRRAAARVRALLGLEPHVPDGRIELDPILPEGAASLSVSNLPLACTRVTIEVDGDAVAVRGLSPGPRVDPPAP